ncbi:MAG TPA: hypothetical protein VKS20_09690 [Candidatus Acidoferrales bacterium]|nr:hypothetical protein [Candidatus Acidoferrales bacterium]
MFFLLLFLVLAIVWVVEVFVRHVRHGPIDFLLVFAVLSLAIHLVWGKFPSRGKRGD